MNLRRTRKDTAASAGNPEEGIAWMNNNRLTIGGKVAIDSPLNADPLNRAVEPSSPGSIFSANTNRASIESETKARP
jgi:hypothetical protein